MQSVCQKHNQPIEAFCIESNCSGTSRFGCLKCFVFGCHMKHGCTDLSELQNIIKSYQEDQKNNKQQEIILYQKCMSLIEQTTKQQRIQLDKFLVELEQNAKEQLEKMFPSISNSKINNIDTSHLLDIQDLQMQNQIFEIYFKQKNINEIKQNQLQSLHEDGQRGKLTEETVKNLETNLNQCLEQTNNYIKEIKRLVQSYISQLNLNNQCKMEFDLNLFENKIKFKQQFKYSCYSIAQINSQQLLVAAEGAQLMLYDFQQNQIIKNLDQDCKNYCNYVLKINEDKFVSGYGKPDCSLKVWNLKNYTIIKELKGHTGIILKLLKVNNNLVLSGSLDKTIILWDIDQYKLLFQFSGHSKGVYRAIELINENTFISGTGDKTIRVWDIQQQKCIKVINHENERCSALLKWDEKVVISGGDSIIMKWDINEGKMLQKNQFTVKHLISSILKLNTQQILVGYNSVGNIMFVDYNTLTVQREMIIGTESTYQIIHLPLNQLAIASYDKNLYILQ